MNEPADLFEMRDNLVMPTSQALLIYPYNEIWERDPMPRKEDALVDFAYLEFMSSPKMTNPFYGYSVNNMDVDPLLTERSRMIIRNIESNRREEGYAYVPDELTLDGMRQRLEFFYDASPSLKYYEANVAAMEKIREWLLNFDMDARDLKTNKPIFTVKAITDGVANSDKVMTALHNNRKKVIEELYETTKTQAGRETNYFEK